MQIHFEWDPTKASSNFKKHGVSFEEATEVFRDPKALTMFDEDHSEDEERWITLGQSSNKNVVVIHTWRDVKENVVFVRLISARPATNREIGQYQEYIYA